MIYFLLIFMWFQTSISAGRGGTVNPFAPFLQPPSTATIFNNLQNVTGNPGVWTIVSGTTCCGGSVTGSSSFTTGNASPSLSGSSIAITCNDTGAGSGTGYNCLLYRILGCSTLPGGSCVGISHALYHFYIWIPVTTTNLQALEYDPDMRDGTYQLVNSYQCDSVSLKWRFWDMATKVWTVLNSFGGVIPTYPCSMLTVTGTWHSIEMYSQWDQTGQTSTYQTLVVDGNVVHVNIANNYPGGVLAGTTGIVIQLQIDGNSTTAANVEYFDNGTLYVW